MGDGLIRAVDSYHFYFSKCGSICTAETCVHSDRQDRPRRFYTVGQKVRNNFEFFTISTLYVHISQKWLQIEAYKQRTEKRFIPPLFNCRMRMDPSLTGFYRVGQKLSDVIPVLRIIFTYLQKRSFNETINKNFTETIIYTVNMQSPKNTNNVSLIPRIVSLMKPNKINMQFYTSKINESALQVYSYYAPARTCTCSLSTWYRSDIYWRNSLLTKYCRYMSKNCKCNYVLRWRQLAVLGVYDKRRRRDCLDVEMIDPTYTGRCMRQARRLCDPGTALYPSADHVSLAAQTDTYSDRISHDANAGKRRPNALCHTT